MGGFPPPPVPVSAPSTPPSTPPDQLPPTEQPPAPQESLVQTPPPVSPSFPRDIYLTSPYMEGEDVTTLQTFLHTNGYPIARTQAQEKEARSPIDGIFGPRTRAALMRFQKIKNLIVDGIFGEKTRGEVKKEMQKES